MSSSLGKPAAIVSKKLKVVKIFDRVAGAMEMCYVVWPQFVRIELTE